MLVNIPRGLHSLTRSDQWKQITIGQSESATFLLTGECGQKRYLKVQSLQAFEKLRQEKEKLEWLQGKLRVPEILYFEQDEEKEYLLISEIPGRNAADGSFEAQPALVIDLLASGLRRIHDLSIEGCPFQQTLQEKIHAAALRTSLGLVDELDFDEVRQEISSEALLQQLISTRPMHEDLVFTHGDYCMPNIIFGEMSINGFIDWGRAGVADRYQDLALAARGIASRYGSAWVTEFFLRYGISEPDKARLDYYQLMDEFF